MRARDQERRHRHRAERRGTRMTDSRARKCRASEEMIGWDCATEGSRRSEPKPRVDRTDHRLVLRKRIMAGLHRGERIAQVCVRPHKSPCGQSPNSEGSLKSEGSLSLLSIEEIAGTTRIAETAGRSGSILGSSM